MRTPDRLTIHTAVAHAHHAHGLGGVHGILTVFALLAFIGGAGLVARLVIGHAPTHEELEEVDDNEPWPR